MVPGRFGHIKVAATAQTQQQQHSVQSAILASLNVSLYLSTSLALAGFRALRLLLCPSTSSSFYPIFCVTEYAAFDSTTVLSHYLQLTLSVIPR